MLYISTSFWVLRTPKSWSKKNFSCFQPFSVNFFTFILPSIILLIVAGSSVLYFISDIFSWFQAWNHWKRLKMNKKGWKRLKKLFRPAFGCALYPKAGRITQHSCQYRDWIFGCSRKQNSFFVAISTQHYKSDYFLIQTFYGCIVSPLNSYNDQLRI